MDHTVDSPQDSINLKIDNQWFSHAETTLDIRPEDLDSVACV